MALFSYPSIIAQHLVAQAAVEEQQRLERFRRAWEAYYGRFPKPLKVTRGKPDDNVIVNKARVIVDKGVSFLFGQDLPFALDAAAGPSSAAEQWLAATWAANRKMTLLQKLALNGSVCGHAFLKLVRQTPYPRLVVLDPATVIPRWDPQDLDRVEAYQIQFSGLDPATGQPRTFRQRIERDGAGWHITDQVSAPDSTVWQTVGEESWRFPWPPIIDCQNLPAPNEYWGISDIEDDILGLNAARNFGLSNWQKINRYHASPTTWGKGFNARELERAVDGTIVLPEAGELHNLEMQGEQESADHLDRRIDEAIHEISRIPPIATGKLDNVGQLSGRALHVLYQPLLEKTGTKRLLYGDLLVELNRRLLELGGYGTDRVTTLQWPALIPGDPKEEAEIALLDQQLGASQETVLRKRGYDPDQERQKRTLEDGALGDQVLRAFERGGAEV